MGAEVILLMMWAFAFEHLGAALISDASRLANGSDLPDGVVDLP
jgi:hypothetical protein